MGAVAQRVFADEGTLQDNSTNAGNVLYTLGFIIDLIMWGYTLVWLFFALASVTRSKFPFNMGWWGFTFPLGVFTTATTQFGKDMPSTFFNVLGTIFSVLVSTLWLIVAVLTVKEVLSGNIFVAPCFYQDDVNPAQEAIDGDVEKRPSNNKAGSPP